MLVLSISHKLCILAASYNNKLYGNLLLIYYALSYYIYWVTLSLGKHKEP